MSVAARSSRLVMLGIDAAEHTVIEALIARGRMPNLARLRQASRYGLLRSPSDLYSGAVWPTFYSGRRVPWHGIYHNKLWRPERMCCMEPDEHAYRARPFWESLGPDLRTCIVDVPLVLGEARGANGVYLNGWATHDSAVMQSWPSSLRRELERDFGSRLMLGDNFGRQDLHSLEQLLGELLRATEQLKRIALALLRRDVWDLACIVFGAAHRAGHYLWDLTQARDAGASTEERRARLAAAVERVYEAIDAALGEIFADIGADTPVIVFSLHGMGPNEGWSEIVPEILDAWRASRSQQVMRQGALYTARKALVGVARPVLRRIPRRLTAQLVPLWSSRMYDWQQTPFFPLPMDLTGLLRINLRGREREGIVLEGSEYQALCAQLEEFLSSLRDDVTGRQIVSSIVRAYEDTPASAPYRDGQPDLIVRWQAVRTSEVPALTSSVLPAFRCPVPRWLPSGRTGNHLPDGWFIAAGPGISAGASSHLHDVLDLAPTARALLGLEPDVSLHGCPIPLGGA
ncbi:MAG: alkaline phosphatase family protein [Steroidobacteraceae bacterium]